MSSFADSHSSRYSSSNQRSSDSQFQLLDSVPFHAIETETQPQFIQTVNHQLNVCLSVGIQTQEIECMVNNSPTTNISCPNCQSLSQRLKSLEKSYKQLGQIVEKQRNMIGKQLRFQEKQREYNYCVSSLKEIIHSFDQEQKEIINFINNALGGPSKKGCPQTLRQFVQTIFTQLIANWQQIMRELDDIGDMMSIRNKSGQRWYQKYNHYQGCRKIAEIKANIRNYRIK